jgi:hypothetical protein
MEVAHTEVDGLSKRIAAAHSEVGVEAAACSGAGIEDGWWWWWRGSF